MSGQPPSVAKPIFTQIRELAADRSSSAMKLMVSGVMGVLLLATFFMSGTFSAITLIDNASIVAERERAQIALDRVLADEAAAPDVETARRIASDYMLAGARIAAADGI